MCFSQSQSQNKELIIKFYTSFSSFYSDGMRECYHPDILFFDNAFGELRGKDAGDMWEMLIKGSKLSSRPLEITYSNIRTTEKNGTVNWIATYLFSSTNRLVINHIQATFEFQDGLIIKHTDVFDFWKWR